MERRSDRLDAPPSRGLTAAARKLRDRLSGAAPEVSAPPRPEDLGWDQTWPFNPDSPVIEGIARFDRPLSIMLVDLSGLDWPQIETLLPVVQASARAQEVLPVLIVDLLDFTGLRDAGFAFDVLPNAVANRPFRPEHDWDGYIDRRRRLLVEKWKPVSIVRLSDHAGEWE